MQWILDHYKDNQEISSHLKSLMIQAESKKKNIKDNARLELVMWSQLVIADINHIHFSKLRVCIERLSEDINNHNVPLDKIFAYAKASFTSAYWLLNNRMEHDHG